mmetsp:Transcript_13398/g.36038  ORF Transcript_13398/g.36038 Transcript_13398/m.36038 type:complete len:318 (-) Transcript_13398:194-1147(-)|eukprot:CAMPEP_0117481928 /NCGR_PEP_ID=MMETSP0784-20121206/13152_1 /TAXON_ID=39447 /ORGANISM="" /LENGTH=317 /DNA_ID=CAMNT_0005276399 /DNA_START=11 /DNA_END=964 /DNA_ORIENTATION=+
MSRLAAIARLSIVVPLCAHVGAEILFTRPAEEVAMCWLNVSQECADRQHARRVSFLAPIRGSAPEFLSDHTASTVMQASSTNSDRDEGVWNPQSPDDLSAKYDTIFSPHKNRNAASHLWSEYILSRASELSHTQISNLFSWFCTVSGSPLGLASKGNTYRTTISKADGSGNVTGVAHHCCWPCSCDVKDLIKVDTKSVTDSSGVEKQYNFHVIGDPCVNSPPRCRSPKEQGCLPFEAPGVACEGGTLQKAIRSDGGHVIIGMFFPADDLAEGEYIDFETEADAVGNSLKSACKTREGAGYNSGMGAIFQQVARLNPI